VLPPFHVVLGPAFGQLARRSTNEPTASESWGCASHIFRLILDTLVRGVPKPRFVAARGTTVAATHRLIRSARIVTEPSVEAGTPPIPPTEIRDTASRSHREGLGFDFSLMHAWHALPRLGPIQRDAVDRLPFLSRTFVICRYYEIAREPAHNPAIAVKSRKRSRRGSGLVQEPAVSPDRGIPVQPVQGPSAGHTTARGSGRLESSPHPADHQKHTCTGELT
jgi:hypothetical protein